MSNKTWSHRTGDGTTCTTHTFRQGPHGVCPLCVSLAVCTHSACGLASHRWRRLRHQWQHGGECSSLLNPNPSAVQAVLTAEQGGQQTGEACQWDRCPFVMIPTPCHHVGVVLLYRRVRSEGGRRTSTGLCTRLLHVPTHCVVWRQSPLTPHHICRSHRDSTNQINHAVSPRLSSMPTTRDGQPFPITT